MIDLDAIEARHAATTSGEWWIDHVLDKYAHLQDTQIDGIMVGEEDCVVYGFPTRPADCAAISIKKADIDFIIHTHNDDIPALIAEVRRLQLRCEMLQAFKDGVTLEIQT